MRDYVVELRTPETREQFARRLATPLTVLLFLVVGCGSADRASSDKSTLASGPVYVRQHVPAGHPQTATPVLVIGEADGPDAFGRTSGLALNPGVGVFITDAQAANVRGYSYDGKRLFTFGHRGSGPGEFKDLRGIAVTPTGNLWLYDYGERRYTEITPTGELVATYRSTVPAFGRSWSGQFGADGRFYDVASVRRGTDNQNVYVAHELKDGTLIPTDTFPLPSTRSDAFYIESSFGVLNIPVPYSAQPFWSFDGNQIWFGDGEQTSVWRRTLPGDTSLVLEFSGRRQPVTNEDRRFAREDLEGALNVSTERNVPVSPVELSHSRS